MQSYQKPHRSLDEQIRALISRGLSIPEPQQARDFLARVSYFRFSAYLRPFQSAEHVFVPSTHWDELVALYQLDEMLRLTVLEVIAPIEVFFRAQIGHRLSERYGAFAHEDRALFRTEPHKQGFNHGQWLTKLAEEARRTNEPFVTQYREQYRDFPRLPLWMACEVMSLGSLSLLYRGLLPEPRRTALSFAELPHEVIRSWLHYLTYLRNLCAHHSRLWNREFAIRPDIPRKQADWQQLALDPARLFTAAVILERLALHAGLPFTASHRLYVIIADIASRRPSFAGALGVPTGRPIAPVWTE